MLIDVEDREGKTILLRALESYNQGLAEKLLIRGADINLVNRDGKTALSILVQRHYLEQVNFLLEKGADPHIEDLQGRDACDYAELGDVHVFPQLNNCRKTNMHLRRRCDVGERKTMEQAKTQTMHPTKIPPVRGTAPLEKSPSRSRSPPVKAMPADEANLMVEPGQRQVAVMDMAGPVTEKAQTVAKDLNTML